MESRNSLTSELSPAHIIMHVQDLDESLKFYQAIGLPDGGHDDDLALFELRGGAHVLLVTRDGAYDNLYESSRLGQREGETLDLMIRGRSREDLEKYRDDVIAAGVSADEIPEQKLYGHSYFTLTDPDGHKITIYTSHEFE